MKAKKILSSILVIAMILGTMSISAFAEENVPTGTLTSSLIDMSDPAETFIASEIKGLNATESVVIKTYDANEKLLATTTLLKEEYYVMDTLGVKIIITGESSSWKTVWEEGMPRADYVPSYAELYVDNQLMNKANVPMTATDGEAAVNWAEVPGVNPAPVAVTGNFAGGHLAQYKDGSTVYITTEIKELSAQESLEIVIHDQNGEDIATTKLTALEYIGFETISAMTCIKGTSAEWSTDWVGGYPRADRIPTTGTLYVDGQKMNTAKISLWFSEDVLVPWSSVDGVKVAEIDGVFYDTLQDAIDAAKDGDTVKLLGDITIDSGANGVNVTGSASFTLDLNGKTIKSNTTNSALRININNDAVTAPVTVNIKNGTITAASSAYCALIAAGKNESVALTVNLENINLNGSNSDGAVVKVFSNAIVNLKDGTVVTGADSYGAVESQGVTNIYDGVELYQNGTTSYNGMLVGVAGDGVANVYGGKGISAKTGLIAMTSGGTINVYGGEWTANTAENTTGNFHVITSQNDKSTYPTCGDSIINVYGGTFNGSVSAWGYGTDFTAVIGISGGTFSEPVAEEYCADGYIPVANEDGTYGVKEGAAANGLTVTKDGGYYAASRDAEEFDEAVIAFNALYENYADTTATKFGMYIYVTEAAKADITSTDINALKTTAGKFTAVVEGISYADKDVEVVALPYIVINEGMVTGSPVTAKASDFSKWLGTSK